MELEQCTGGLWARAAGLQLLRRVPHLEDPLLSGRKGSLIPMGLVCDPTPLPAKWPTPRNSLASHEREGLSRDWAAGTPTQGAFGYQWEKFPTHTGLTKPEFLPIGSYNEAGQALWAQVGLGAGV